MRPGGARSVLLVAALATFAGCVVPQLPAGVTGGIEPFAPDFDFAAVVEQGHDHADPSLHEGAFGLALAGFSDLNEAARPVAPGGYQELAMAGGWAFVSNFGPDRGFTIVDVGDPARPRKVSDFFPSRALGLADAGGGTYWDVSVTEDATLVILSAQAVANAPLGAARADEQGGGVYLVNVEDKANPVLESFTPFLDRAALIATGVHNANPFEAGGRLHVAATTANGVTHLLEVVGDAPRRTLRALSVVDGMHDSAVQAHPLTNQTLLYTAAPGGVFIWDVGDPARPLQVGIVADGSGRYYHETIPSNVLIGGRHYTLATTESMGEPTPFTLIDTTDPTQPEVAGEWILPVEITERTTPYQYSGHNVDFDRGRVYIGHQHAGVWVLDVSTPARVAAPVPVAVYLPHEPAFYAPRTVEATPTPMVWRATYHTDGFVWAVDTNSGLYALRPEIPASPLEDAPIYPHNIR